MKTPRITSILKGAVARADSNISKLSNDIGMPYQTLRRRLKYPETWRFYEWKMVLKHVPFTDEELTEIREEVRK